MRERSVVIFHSLVFQTKYNSKIKPKKIYQANSYQKGNFIPHITYFHKNQIKTRNSNPHSFRVFNYLRRIVSCRSIAS